MPDRMDKSCAEGSVRVACEHKLGSLAVPLAVERPLSPVDRSDEDNRLDDTEDTRPAVVREDTSAGLPVHSLASMTAEAFADAAAALPLEDLATTDRLLWSRASCS